MATRLACAWFTIQPVNRSASIVEFGSVRNSVFGFLSTVIAGDTEPMICGTPACCSTPMFTMVAELKMVPRIT